MITQAFTCTGAYAILIMLGIKRVENRSARPVPRRGRCAVSCSKSFCQQEFGEFVRWAAHALPPEEFARLSAWSDVKDWPGRIVGACDYEVSETADSAAWNEGYRYWWKLSEVRCFDTPIPCRGNVGMWQLPETLAKQVTWTDCMAKISGSRIDTAEDAAKIFKAVLPLVGEREGLFVLPLDDTSRALSEPILVSVGTDPRTTAVPLGSVLGEVLKSGASAFIVAHNHPSGKLSPSAEDIEFTTKLVEVSRTLSLSCLDHIILGAEGAFVSLAARRPDLLSPTRGGIVV